MDDHVLDILGKNWGKEGKQHITGRTIHLYTPYTSGYDHNDEIRISIPNKDIVTLPSESVLVIEGKATKEDGTGRSEADFVMNGFAHLFSEIRYEINGVVVDYIRNAGITSTMKNKPLLSPAERRMYMGAAWPEDQLLFYAEKNQNEWLIRSSGYFCGWIPMKLLLGFCEDHTCAVTGVKHELVLIRSRTDRDALFTDIRRGGAAPPPALPNPKITISRICWRMPHLSLSDQAALYISKTLDSGRRLPIKFTRWELNELPNVPEISGNYEWTVKATNGMHQPQFLLFTMQHDARNQINKDTSWFSLEHLRSVKLYLNEKFFPYSELRLRYGDDNALRPEVYDMLSNFEKRFCNRDPISTITANGLSSGCEILCFDLTEMPEPTISSTVNIKIVMETLPDHVIPKNTSAYCLILHQQEFAYQPLTDIVTHV